MRKKIHSMPNKKNLVERERKICKYGWQMPLYIDKISIHQIRYVGGQIRGDRNESGIIIT